MIDVSNSVGDVAFRLGFLSQAEMATDSYWVTIEELYQFADDLAKKLAYSTGIFPILAPAIPVTPGSGLYQLPATHVFTVLAWINYADSIQRSG